MKRQPNQPKGAPARGAGTVYRFLAVSAFLGLLIGIFEAARLWTTPRVIPLLAPDVGWVIWFLAPLVDMAFFALVGLGLGLAASRTRHKELFVAAGVGVTVTFVTLMLVWFHREIGLHALDFQMEVTTPLALFGLVTFVSFLVLAVAWSRLAAFANRWLDRLTKPLARVLGACAAAAILGIGTAALRYFLVFTFLPFVRVGPFLAILWLMLSAAVMLACLWHAGRALWIVIMERE